MTEVLTGCVKALDPCPRAMFVGKEVTIYRDATECPGEVMSALANSEIG